MKLSPKNRRLLQIAAAVLVIAAALFAMLPSPQEVDLASVDRGPLAVILRHEGKTRVMDRYIISAPVSGRVERITLEPGDRVVAGKSALITLRPDDPVLLDTRTRREAEATLRAAEAELERAKATRRQQAAEYALARSEFERIERLHGEQVASQSSLDEASTAERSAAEILAAAEASLRRARSELDRARARLMPVRPAAGTGNFQVLAPIDGVVLRRLRESEGAVLQGAPLVEIADTGRLEIVADFLSTDAVQFRPGMTAVIDGWGGRRDLSATVRRVEPFGFMKISALGVEEQRVNVILDFDDPEAAWSALGDGYRVQVGVVVWRGEDVLRVPVSALFRDGTQWAVYQVKEGRARLTRVEIGRQNGLFAEVSSGLVAEAEVIVHPADSIAEGARVTRRQL